MKKTEHSNVKTRTTSISADADGLCAAASHKIDHIVHSCCTPRVITKQQALRAIFKQIDTQPDNHVGH